MDNLKLITFYANYGKSTTKGSFAPARPFEAISDPRGEAMEEAILLSYVPMKGVHILGGLVYKTSEYYYQNQQVEILDVDLLVTYNF